MSLRSLLVATALVLPACAGIGSELKAPATRVAQVPQLDLSHEHLAFPALRTDATLPSADNTAMHMEKVLGRDSAAADIRLCVDARGDVTTATLVKTSGVSSYDSGVLNDVRAWKFEAPGTERACSDLTVIYTLK